MRTISILTLTLLCACGIGCAATVSASIAADCFSIGTDMELHECPHTTTGSSKSAKVLRGR